ncbi:MAG: zinc ribbon domain-containing protein, partial [Nocardioides sp.]|uniref:hypothetical protein n=1 Tax=Nocardioides sp. TaxID=35761 RepID=UPI0039E447B7
MLADPQRCPDCRGALTPGAAACQWCGLPLGGALGSELFATLQRADALIARLRAGSAPIVTSPPVTPPPLPQHPQQHPSVGTRALTVPGLLLALGALMLGAGAITFLAFAWSWLGYSGRTILIVLATAASAAGTWLAASRRIRLAAEALTALTAILAALVPVGATHAGWFGSRHEPQVVTLSGLVLLVLASAARYAVERRTAQELVLAEIAGSIAAAAAAAGLAAWLDDRSATTAAIVLVAA